MQDSALMRQNMVESQIRPNDVTDLRILTAMLRTPRETCVPASMRALAYMDQDIALTMSDEPVSEARYLMAPMPFARLIQLADIMSTDLVLDIGCVTGYSTAIIAQLAESVVGLDENADLVDAASKNLQELGIDNAAIVKGDLRAGYPAEGPYNVIVMEGSVVQVPDVLFDQLKEGGRLVAISSSEHLGQAVLYRKNDGKISQWPAFDAHVAPLRAFAGKPQFVF